MNKKNGFTLIELLCVIAILAILVLLTLPNILKIFDNAKKNSFLNETKSIYKAAESQIILDLLKGNTNTHYANYEGNTNNKIDLTNEDINYCLIYNKDKFVHVAVSNKEYSYTLKNSKGIDITSIDKIDDIYTPVVDCANSTEELEAFTRLTYLESKTEDSQYIDTGYKMNSKSEFVVEGMVISGDTALFGARNAMSGDQRYTLQFIKDDKYRVSFKKTNYYVDDTVYKKNNKYIWNFSANGLKIDDKLQTLKYESQEKYLTKFSTYDVTHVDSDLNIYLFCFNDEDKGGAINFGKVRIYSFKIYEDDNLIMDLVPALDRRNKVCMHDMVNGNNYYNQGNGNFTQGPIVIVK